MHKFDYLSTVSGGGYLGASLGRLYGPSVPASAVESGIASNDSMWLWWLRNNGRYLTPAGLKDIGYAGASIVRGVISTHLEIGVLITLLAAAVLLPHFLVSLFPPFQVESLWQYSKISALPSAWLWLLVLPAWWCIYQIFGYWYTRETHRYSSILLVISCALGFAIAAAFMLHSSTETASPLCTLGGLCLVAPTLAALAVAIDAKRSVPVNAQRLSRTKKLAYGLLALALFCALSCLDWISWQLTSLYWGGEIPGAVLKLGGGVLVIATIARLALPELQRWLSTRKRPRANIQRSLNGVGILLSILVAIFWTTTLSILIYPDKYHHMYWDPGSNGLLSIAPLIRLLTVVAICTGYVLLSRKSFELLNLSSLHNFYRARIERAYVSSGNAGGTGGRFPCSPLDRVTRQATAKVAPLTESIDGDDVDLEGYTPHKWGGPIHLINCCVNQTVDDRTGLYNADRKGVSLTVSSLGVETGTQLPLHTSSAGSLGRLSKWIAIPGAAAGTGMGSQTTPGLAALLFMSGIRLGYWTASLIEAPPTHGRRLRESLFRIAPKPFAIVGESLARFPGLLGPYWYVSDGGHFDNTGIHALLKRRLPVIVAADCGADPKYLFGDIESLVRKAKIDYGIGIDFVKSNSPHLDGFLSGIVGTPETIHPDMGDEWLLVGRINYGNGSFGTLVVVKPRRIDAMPFDLVAYADRNADFPQQTTGDQFFDEAQWEAYHQLGLLMGKLINSDLIDNAISAAEVSKDERSSLRLAQDPPGYNSAAKSRLKRAGLSVSATVGAGLSLSLLFAAWQGYEKYLDRSSKGESGYEDRLNELHFDIERNALDSSVKRRFESVARESKARGDGAIQALVEALGHRCSNLPAGSDPAPCLAVHRQVEGLAPSSSNKDYYDYWFKDKYGKFLELRPPAKDPSAPTTRPPSTAAAPSIAPPGSSMPHDLSERRESAAGIRASTTSSDGPCPPDIRVVTYIYDEDSRASAVSSAEDLAISTDAKTFHVENVNSITARDYESPPRKWDTPTLVYSRESNEACIGAVREAFGSRLSYAEINAGNPNTLKLWIPPANMLVRHDGQLVK